MPQQSLLPQIPPSPLNAPPLPREAPNRPAGQDVLSDAVDALLALLGINDPLAGEASKATQFGGLLGAALPIKAGIRAFHGSPHDFDKFSLAKINTGEGAQSFGHGLYFAENEGVARSYKSALTDFGFPDGDPRTGIATILANKGEAEGLPLVQRAYKSLGDQLGPAIADAQKAISEKGRMYEVNLKADPEHFLDWDKKVSEQSEHVRKALADAPSLQVRDGMPLAGGGTLRIEHNADFGPRYFMESHGSRFRLNENEVRNLIGNGEQGKSAYQALSAHLGGDQAASDHLRQAGVPGIRYLDGGSRSSGQGSYNYVVNDDSIIDILRKFGIALPFLAGGAAAQPLMQRKAQQ